MMMDDHIKRILTPYYNKCNSQIGAYLSFDFLASIPMSSLLITVFVLAACGLFAQESSERIEGEVTFTTSQNVYIRFGNTDQVEVGDTLYRGAERAVPCLRIERKSSSSVIGFKILDCGLEKGDVIFVRTKTFDETKDEGLNNTVKTDSLDSLSSQNIERDSLPPKENKGNLEKISGRLSTATYSNFSQDEDRHRAMMRFSVNADNIRNSNFSFQAYMNYRRNFITNTELSSGQNKFFRVFNLSLKYDVNPTLSMSLGRRINSKISSVGAIDGFQIEKEFGKSYIGSFIGFRPDIFTHGVNPRLLEYGAYFGFKSDSNRLYSETTFGLLEQLNNGAIDRRYAYFQHSSTISRNLNIFASMEVDLFTDSLGASGDKPRITSLYSSVRYRFNRRIAITISHDTRKRIIFYETFRSDVEELLADDIARQGLRIRVNISPLRNVFIGISYSKRFQSDQQNKSDNINGFVSLFGIPRLGGRLTVNFNLNHSNYLESQVLSFRYARTIINKRLEGSFYYRVVNYVYSTNENKLKQYYFGANLAYRISKTWRLSVLCESSNRSEVKATRINTKIIKRF